MIARSSESAPEAPAPVNERRFQRWTPDAGQEVVFVTDGSEVERVRFELVDALVTLPPGGEAGLPDVELALRCDLATYRRLEQHRWFGIPYGFAERVGAGFDGQSPVELVVTLKSPERMGLPLGMLLAGTPEDELLGKLMRPLIEEDLWFPTRTPYSWEVVRVTQIDAEGNGRGFGQEAIAAFEGRAPAP